MTTAKKIRIAPEALIIIEGMRFSESADGFIGTIQGQLDRSLYLEVNKGLETLGGKWNRKLGGHHFKLDPRPDIYDLLDSGVVTVERDGFFETPPDIAKVMIRLAKLRSGMIVLEPSAGLGALALEIRKTCVGLDLRILEKNEERARFLERAGYTLVGRDFLVFSKDSPFKVDRVIQNPPFEDLQDIDHVHAAYEMLKSGGRLVSVMSEGPFFRTGRKAEEFRNWLSDRMHQVVNLERGAFKESGTMIKARIVVIGKE